MYPRAEMRAICSALDRTKAAVANRARRLGIERIDSPDARAAYQEKSRLMKARSSEVRHPWTADIGTEFVGKDGRTYRKVSETGESHKDWVLSHHVEWEKHHGAVPPGWIVTFRDGNKSNCAIENLHLISRAENMARNSIHRYPKEIVRTTAKISSFLKRLKQLEKQQHEKPE